MYIYRIIIEEIYFKYILFGQLPKQLWSFFCKKIARMYVCPYTPDKPRIRLIKVEL